MDDLITFLYALPLFTPNQSIRYNAYFFDHDDWFVRTGTKIHRQKHR
jgi:hypothetical protein